MATGKADVDTTALLGGKQLRVFGRAPWPETKVAQEAMWAPMVASLQEICEYARPFGIQIAIQNHNRSSFCMYSWQILRMIEEVDRENFGHIMDTGMSMSTPVGSIYSIYHSCSALFHRPAHCG